MANVTLKGYVYNNAGEGVSGATAEAFPVDDATGSAVVSDTTDGNGRWDLDVSTEGMYDVRITSGSSIRWIKYNDCVQMTELEVADFHIRNPANTFDYDIVPAAIVADRQLNLPLITATDTLTTVGLAQTWSAIQTHSADIVLQDDVDVAFGTGSDTLVRWSDADSDNHSFVVGLGSSNAAMHLANSGDVAVDWNVSAEADPQLFIHCNTNPATEYLRIGNLDATNAEIDLVGGTTIKFQIDGTDEMTLTASAIDMKDNTVDLGDAKGTRYGAGQDAELRWSTGDSSNHAFVIGLGASNAALHLANQGDIATDWNVSAEADPQLFIHCNTNPATEYLRIGNLDATNAEIDLVGGTTIKFQIDGTDEMTLTASALDLKSNNLVFSSGSGISFAATADSAGMTSELLDDYEEGTWTPTIGDNNRHGTNESQGYTTQIGHYTKIGNWVHFMCTVVMSDKGDMTTSEQAAILGLPYSTENTANTTFPVVVGDATSLALGSAGQVVTGFVAYNSDNINLRLWDSTAGVTDCTVGEVSDGAKLNVSGHYKIA